MDCAGDSGARISENGTFEIDFLLFFHSHGYNCQRYFNLCVLDPDTIVYASGCLIHILDTKTGELKFRRHQGIGHIAKNPTKPHIAVAEAGPNPPILIYSYPDFKEVVKLSDGTSQRFSQVAYNSTGDLLVSQGAGPDYWLTIWNWAESSIKLRTQSFNLDVFNIVFSTFSPESFATAGAEHVKFWKMVTTFTGEKLQGTLGKFGTTDDSDVIGVLPMADGKVVSGCQWGNILLWSEGSILLEVRRKNKKPCHDNMITQFEFNHGELMSVGMDGWIKIWYYDSIDNDSSEDFVEVEPIYEFRIFQEVNGIDVNSMLMCVRKKNYDPEDSFWYAQDGNGGLWLIDLATMTTPQKPQKLLTCHAGAITDIAVCSWSSFLASVGDYQLNIYDYLKKTLILNYRFSDVCTQVIWVPCSVESTGSTLICSFASGVLRVLVVDFSKICIFLVQITKPHTERIRIMTLNSSKRLLVTAAEDSTIFVFKVVVDKVLKLEAVGFVRLPAAVHCLAWKSEDILLGCKELVLRLKVPETRPAYTKISYELVECRLETFEIFDDRQRGLDKDIITIDHLNDEVWLASDRFVYGLKLPEVATFGDITPLKAKRKDLEEDISSWLISDKYLILGLKTGEIKVCNLSNLSDYWVLPIHENLNGEVTKILMSYDNKFLFTAGRDGNIFSFLTKNKGINFETAIELKSVEEVADIEDHLSLEEVIKKKEADRLLEEARKRKEETLATLEVLRDEYNQIVERNNELPKSQQLDPEELELDPRITEDLKRELQVKLDDVYRKSEFDLEKSRLGLEKLLDFYIRPLTCVPFAVCRISKPGSAVHSVREKILGDDFGRIYGGIQKEIQEIQVSERNDGLGVEEESHDEFVEEDEEIKVEGVESFLKGLSPETIQHKLGAQINQMLRKYRERKARHAQRAQEWKIMHAGKPNLEADNEEDVRAVEEAKKTIGDYKLKISNDFEYDKDFKAKRDTTLSKYKQLLDCRKKTHLLREVFNERLREVRSKKLDLQKEVAGLIDKLKFIHSELPEKYIKPLPKLLEMNYDIEFPERHLEMEKYKSLAEKFNESRSKQYSKSSTESRGQTNFDPKFYDEEYEILLLDQRMIDSQLTDLEGKDTEALRVSVTLEIPEDKIEEMKSQDREQTPWELEMKLARVAKKIYQQDCIIGYVEKSYREIDEELEKLEKERLEVQADSIYSELHQLTLQQELIVLREFEDKENLLIKKVDHGIYKRESVERKIQKLNNSMDVKKKEVLKITDKIKEVNRQFGNMISENKFSEYLKKIYRKKFKLTRITDESSESSSSDSSTDDNQLSTDDENFYHLTLDENTCPAGCDEDLYKSAFSMREKRHEFEARVRDDQKILENLRKQLDQETKKMKVIDNNLETSRRELQDYLKEKQKKLNEIDVTVILKLHQLQHVKGNDLEKISDCVVFDKDKLSQLYTRVGELQQETTDQKIKHKKNRQHLHRVEIDCDYMESEIKRLKEEIKQEMIQKFGREISLTSLYEAVLRRMVYDIKADTKEMIKSYDKEIKGAKEQYKKQVKVLEELIKENTEKLGLMTALEEEQRKLKRIMKRKPENEEKTKKVEKEYQEELKRLEIILRNQRQQKELFRNEIRSLRLKSRPLPPVYRKSTKVLSLDEEFKLGDNLMENGNLAAELEDLVNNEVQKFMSEFDGDNCKELVTEMVDNSKIGKSLSSLKKINDILKVNLGDKYEDQDLRDVISRLEAESETLQVHLSLNWNVKSKIDELLTSLDFKADTATVNSLVNYLQTENSVEDAVDYLVGKLSSSDSEVTTAVRDYASKMLAEIKKLIGKD